MRLHEFIRIVAGSAAWPLVLNRKAAKALELMIPAGVMSIVDEVIE